MTTKFLYIDDEPQKAKGIIKSIEDSELVFEVESPRTWNDQKSYLIDSKKLDEYDGLLLDLKLQFTDNENNDIKYKGGDLAQSIRTDVKSDKIKDLPIFLCSTDALMMSILDRTSYDLFDKKYDKDIFSSNENIKAEFLAFPEAYHLLNEKKDFESITGKKLQDELLPLQIELLKCKTPHEIIYLIQNYVIKCNGLLLDEELLAIRLGINHKESSDWNKLKDDLLNVFKYEGILNGCYERWWQIDVLKWWKEEFGTSLKVMCAADKVKILVEKFGLQNITALSLPENHRFDTFWYKCRLSKYPLEPSDALRTIEMPRYIWQEPSYISIAYIKSEERVREDIIPFLGANELKIFEAL